MNARPDVVRELVLLVLFQPAFAVPAYDRFRRALPLRAPRGAPQSSGRDSAAPGNLPRVVPLTSSFHFDGSSMALPNDLPPTPTTEPVAPPPLSGAPTAAQLKGDIESGATGDKNPVRDPGLAPLGTDDEAAGHP